MEDWGLVVPVLIDCPHGCISFMAGRRYVRDNKGRFASTGATARGGRLATASGNKRATQTMQAEGGAKGTIGKPKGLKPTAAKPAASGVSAIPKGSVRRYAALERAASTRTQNAARASSRANSPFGKPSQRDAQARLALTEGGRAARAKATMRKLSNTPAGQQPPTLPKARAVGQRMKNTLPGGAYFAGNYKLSGGGYRGNGRWSSSGKDLSRVKAARPASTMAKMAAKPAVTTGRRKPLKGVGATLARNLSGFKGLPVSVRSRKQAAAYQGARRRSMLSYNAVSTGGTFKRGVNRQPNLLTGGVDRVGAGKFRPVYKKKRG